MKLIFIILIGVVLIPIVFFVWFSIDYWLVSPWLYERRTAQAHEANQQEWQNGDVHIFRVIVDVVTEAANGQIASEVVCAKKRVTRPKTFKSGALDRDLFFALNNTRNSFPVSDISAKSIVLDTRRICAQLKNIARGFPIELESHLFSEEKTGFASSDPGCLDLWQQSDAAFGLVELIQPRVTSVRRIPLRSVISKEAYAPTDTSYAADGQIWRPDFAMVTGLDSLERSVCDLKLQ